MSVDADRSRANPRLVLASTSPYRKALLERLGLEFGTTAPNIDESPLPGEDAQALVLRLAQGKARVVADDHPESLIIGSDQVACLDGEILGKPGSRSAAIEQLARLSGNRVSFYTGLCLFNSATAGTQVRCELFHVHFRQLDRDQIEDYLDRDQPFNCAGSFRSEGLGIALFRRMEGEDPNSLIGLPLIRLIDMLAKEGVAVI